MIEQILMLLHMAVEGTSDKEQQKGIATLCTKLLDNLAEIGSEIDSKKICNVMVQHSWQLFNSYCNRGFTREEAVQLTCAILNRGSK